MQVALAMLEKGQDGELATLFSIAWVFGGGKIKLFMSRKV